MGWSRVTVTGNLSRLSSVCVPLLVMAQRALRGLPASQAPTCGLAACAHLARHTYLPRQKVPSASLTSPIPVLMPLIPSHRQRHRGALTSPSRTARKVGRSGLLPMHRRDAGAPGPPDRARAEQGPGLGLEEVPGSGQSGGQGKQDKADKWRGQQGEPEGPRKGLRGSWRGEAGARRSSRFPGSLPPRLARALPCRSRLYPGLASPALGVASPGLLPNEAAPFVQLLQLLHVCALAQSVITCDLWAWLFHPRGP